MVIFRAFRDGIRRVSLAPAVLAGVLIATLLAALPLGLVLRASLRTHLGDSVEAEAAASGVNWDWWQEFSAQATGLGTTFSPSVIGFGVALDNLSSILDNRPTAGVLVGVATAYLFLWIFLVGGILDRYARQRPTRVAGFFSACGVYFFRFLRLGVVAWLAYAALFGFVHGWLLNDFYGWATNDFTVERNAFLVRAALYLLFGTLLIACNLILDYAKIRAVVEDRRSMTGALLAGWRFVTRRPLKVCGLYALNGLLFLLVLAAYAAAAPGAGGTGGSMWLGFLIGQLYILARLWTKLLFYASQTALFQGELAHAEYTAAPQPVWPESPAAEAIGPQPTHYSWVQDLAGRPEGLDYKRSSNPSTAHWPYDCRPDPPCAGLAANSRPVDPIFSAGVAGLAHC